MLTFTNLKWLATAFILLGGALTAFNAIPLSFIAVGTGAVLWSFVAHHTHDTPLLIVNVVGATLNFIGVANFYY